MKIASYVSKEGVTVAAEDGSIASLDKAHWASDEFNLGPGNWYWFSRLKAKEEGRGVGTLLMRELVGLCDEHGIDIFCQLNPYGRLDYEQLRAFYKKFGLVDVTVDGSHAMIRRCS